MTKTEFAERVLKNRKNTMFSSKEQVLAAVDIFEEVGMLPPFLQTQQKQILYNAHINPNACMWEETFQKLMGKNL